MFILSFASFLSGFNGARAYKISLRDGQNHSIPNAGIPETAFAGALGLKFGIQNYYDNLLV
jgi:adenosylcobinamide-phosphate synthase